MRRLRTSTVCLTLVVGLLGAAAARAEPAHIFRLPSEPIDTALVRFAIQGAVSIGGFPVAGCAGPSRPVLGMLAPTEALRRMLPPGCGFERVDARAYRVTSVRLAPTAPALAQPFLPSPRPAELTEIVVTAEKRREPLRGSPFAVSVVTRSEVERGGGKSFADLAASIPGVVETNLGPGRNKILIRGISDGAFTGRTQSTVGLYLDDVPITRNAPDPALRLADIDRVEVLRGPQGTLYGSGSIGGIVRVVTAPPDTAAFAARVVVEGVINDHHDRAFGGEVMVNIPVVADRVAIRGVIYRDETTGYLSNPGLGLEDVNQGHRLGGRLAALVELPGGWKAQATFVRQAIDVFDSQYVQGGGGPFVRDAAIPEPHHNDFAAFSGTLSRQTSVVDIRISGAYIDHDLATRYDATGALGLRRGQVAAFDESQRVGLWVAEAVLASTGQARWRWLAGVSGASAVEDDGAQLDASLYGGVLRSVYHRRDHLLEGAVFGEVSYDVTSKLTVVAGGRFFRVETRSTADGFELARAPLPNTRVQARNQGFSPKLRVSYAFRPDRLVYAQVQDGYRAGGFNTPAGADGVANGRAAIPYLPDRLLSLEVGGEATFFDGALGLRAAAFQAHWQNVQTDQFRSSGLPVTLNIGDGTSTGLEFDVTWRPDEHWRLRVGGLLNEPQLSRASDQFPARIDIGLPGVAKVSGSIDVTYRHPLTVGLRGELSARFAYVGRSFTTFDGSAASAMGDYGLGRIAASLKGEAWEVQAFVENLTNEKSDTFAFGNPFSRDRAQQSTPLPPRSFGLAIRRDF